MDEIDRAIRRFATGALILCLLLLSAVSLPASSPLDPELRGEPTQSYPEEDRPGRVTEGRDSGSPVSRALDHPGEHVTLGLLQGSDGRGLRVLKVVSDSQGGLTVFEQFPTGQIRAVDPLDLPAKFAELAAGVPGPVTGPPCFLHNGNPCSR